MYRFSKALAFPRHSCQQLLLKRDLVPQKQSLNMEQGGHMEVISLLAPHQGYPCACRFQLQRTTALLDNRPARTGYKLRGLFALNCWWHFRNCEERAYFPWRLSPLNHIAFIFQQQKNSMIIPPLQIFWVTYVINNYLLTLM